MTERLSRDAVAGDGGAARGTVRLLTVDDVRAALACVARGEFGRAPEGVVEVSDGSTVPVDGSVAVSDDSEVPSDDGAVVPGDGAVVPEGSAAALGDGAAVSGGRAGALGGGSSVPSGDEYTSATLLDDWTRTAVDGDRLKALQSAQLAAFVLTRVLNRPDGEEELDDFLAARNSIDSEGKWQVGRSERPEAPGGSDGGGAAGATGGAGGAGDAGQEAGSEGQATNASFGAGIFDDPRISTRARELLAPEDALILAAKLRTRLETARRTAARAVVAFLGLHNLLKSAASGRLPFERVDRLHFRLDDALLPLSHVQTLDGYLDGLDAKLSMDQFEKQARMRIRTLAPVERDPEAARKNRCVRIERRDDDTAVLEMVGPITVIEALYQRLRAMARAIRRHEIGALGLTVDGHTLDANDVVSRVSDDRRMAELIFDLLAGARPQTQLRVGRPDRQAGGESGQVGSERRQAGSERASGVPGQVGSKPGCVDSEQDRACSERVGAEGDGSPSGCAAADGADLPEGTLIDVLCPTDGDWLRRQAAVTITVPVSTVLSLDDAPGRINGDIPLGAEHCRAAAAHATSWTRVLTDPATSIVTDHVAHTYEPTAAMRRTIRQKWRTCTAPGCSRPAVECEIEHCCRFSKRDPASGGLTIMENLHVMCKHHHELKTRGIIRLTRLSRTEVVWALPVGVEAFSSAPPLGTGIDPPDPQHLLARANDLDACFAGGEANDPDLFTVVDGVRTEDAATVDEGITVEEGRPSQGPDDPDCRDTTGSDSDVPPPF
ncbi:HNH endonuclease signature motif containing protein [Brevibacterium yomogidense]|uniref:HNH endonuclease signature motif containing protein n=1 Tax=Brevibacterium yomogidense TaxID=946573 RepID=UPI0022B769F0|nr:HNH endonuclease signature motif containing protein [Brevibacterium yomogidense]